MNRKDFLKAGLVMIGGVWTPKQHGATIIVRGPHVPSAPAGASFSDDFNRSNEFPLGGPNWTGTGIGGWQDMYLLSNVASGAANNALARVTTTAATFASNHSATITVVSGSTTFVGPAVRIQGTTNGACYIAYYEGGSVWKIQKSDSAASLTQVGTDISNAGPSAGDTITLEANGDGTSTDLVLKLNGSTIGTRTDASSPLTGGQPGLWAGSSINADDFSAADL